MTLLAITLQFSQHSIDLDLVTTTIQDNPRSLEGVPVLALRARTHSTGTAEAYSPARTPTWHPPAVRVQALPAMAEGAARCQHCGQPPRPAPALGRALGLARRVLGRTLRIPRAAPSAPPPSCWPTLKRGLKLDGIAMPFSSQFFCELTKALTFFFCELTK